ncbi:MAG: RluA family pseudouridine synthase, partial [Rickettsiales bacterium]
MMEKLFLTISQNEDNIRLDRFIRNNFDGILQSIIEKSIRNGLIRLNNKKSNSNNRLKIGDEVSIAKVITERLTTKVNNVKIPQKYSIEDLRKSILFVDENIIVINKRSGIATQGGSKIKESIDNIIKYIPEFRDLNPKLVHRLDKDTSGVLIVACNDSSTRMLTKAFREKKIIKKYIAIVSGLPRPKQGIIDTPIEKLNIDNYEKMSPSKDGNHAVTHYSVIDNLSDKAALVMFTPITGRTHQIRVHAKEIGTPIIGDKKYGFFDENLNIDQNKLNLHSLEIDTVDLFSKNIWRAPLPKHMIDNI